MQTPSFVMMQTALCGCLRTLPALCVCKLPRYLGMRVSPWYRHMPRALSGPLMPCRAPHCQNVCSWKPTYPICAECSARLLSRIDVRVKLTRALCRRSKVLHRLMTCKIKNNYAVIMISSYLMDDLGSINPCIEWQYVLESTEGCIRIKLEKF